MAKPTRFGLIVGVVAIGLSSPVQSRAGDSVILDAALRDYSTSRSVRIPSVVPADPQTSDALRLIGSMRPLVGNGANVARKTWNRLRGIQDVGNGTASPTTLGSSVPEALLSESAASLDKAMGLGFAEIQMFDPHTLTMDRARTFELQPNGRTVIRNQNVRHIEIKTGIVTSADQYNYQPRTNYVPMPNVQRPVFDVNSYPSFKVQVPGVPQAPRVPQVPRVRY